MTDEVGHFIGKPFPEDVQPLSAGDSLSVDHLSVLKLDLMSPVEAEQGARVGIYSPLLLN